MIILATQFGLDTHDVAALCMLAEIGGQLGLHRAVAHLLQKAVSIAPNYAPARYRWAASLHHAGEDGAALDALSQFPETQQAPAVLALRGAVSMRLGRVLEAAGIYARAVRAAPADPYILMAHGHAQRALGQRHDAVVAYRSAIERSPELGEAYWSIADLKTASLDVEDRAAMERQLERSDLPATTRSHFHFALGRALEEVGSYESAFTHYQAGNDLRHSTSPWDADALDRFVSDVIAATDESFFRKRHDWGDPSTDPIFVLGMPRAGSSLVEQILASHSEVEGLSELSDLLAVASPRLAQEGDYAATLSGLAADTFADMGAEYLARVRSRRSSAGPFVDKFPGNFLHIPLLHLMLPGAHVIDIRRDARDCCVSLFTQSFAEGQSYSYELSQLGRYYRAYVRLMDHIEMVLPARVLRVSYEAMIDDLECEVRRMLEYCQLPFEEGCLRFFENDRAVRTASSEQVRQPIYRASIGRWRHFEPWLEPLLHALGTEAA